MGSSPQLSLAVQSYAASETYLRALQALLSPRVGDWSISFEIDVPPFSTFERVLQTASVCQRLGIGFYLDDLCMRADHLTFQRRWLEPDELDRLAHQCPEAFLGVRLHPEIASHDLTPNRYDSFLAWNATHRREIQLVVSAARWPGSDWERTTSVHVTQPWTVLSLVPLTVGAFPGPQRLRRRPPGAALGYCFRLSRTGDCDLPALRERLAACLETSPACLAFDPVHIVVDNPGSAKLPPDLHDWPLFNTVDALRPGARLVLTPCGEVVARAVAA